MASIFMSRLSCEDKWMYPISILSNFWKCICIRLILDLCHAGVDEEAVQVRGGHLAVQEEDQVQQLWWVSWRGPGLRCRCEREIKDRCEVNVKKYSPKITPLTCQKGPSDFIEIRSHHEYKFKGRPVIGIYEILAFWLRQEPKERQCRACVCVSLSSNNEF